MQVVNTIMTPGTITFIMESTPPKTVTVDHPKWETIRKLVMVNELEAAYGFVDVKEKIKKQGFEICYGKSGVDGISYLNELLPAALSNRIMQFMKAGLDAGALKNLWLRLKKNPVKRSQECLYEFLEKNHVPITPEGCFLAYKAVRVNFKDIHSGEFDNTPGTEVTMPREQVNPDPNVTCSTGLHVAAWDYAKNCYGSDNTPLVEVLVDPADVVAVPHDYGQQKIRVCRYVVVRVCDKEHKQQLYSAPKKSRVSAPKSQEQVTKMEINANSRGQLQVPAKLLRQLTHSRPVYVIHTHQNSRFLKIALEPDESAPICAELNGDEVRIASSYVRLMNAGSDYVVTLKEDHLEVRPLV